MTTLPDNAFFAGTCVDEFFEQCGQDPCAWACWCCQTTDEAQGLMLSIENKAAALGVDVQLFHGPTVLSGNDLVWTVVARSLTGEWNELEGESS